MKRILGVLLSVYVLSSPSAWADPRPNVLETMTDFATKSLEAAYQSSLNLHAAVEELVYESTGGSRENALKALNDARGVYLQAEIYGVIGCGGETEIQRLINADLIHGCSVDYSAGNSVGGLVKMIGRDQELSTQDLYNLKSKVKGETTGFSVIQYLLTADYDQDYEGQRYQYALACAELLSRNIQELQRKWSSNDLLTAGDTEQNINRILAAVTKQAEKNRALLAIPDCDDDITISKIIEGNLSGIYQLWIGLYAGPGAGSNPRTGLQVMFANRDDNIGERVTQNTRSLFNAARLLGNVEVRRDKDQHLAAFSARTRGKIDHLLAEQIKLWTALAGPNAPQSAE